MKGNDDAFQDIRNDDIDGTAARDTRGQHSNQVVCVVFLGVKSNGRDSVAIELKGPGMRGAEFNDRNRQDS